MFLVRVAKTRPRVLIGNLIIKKHVQYFCIQINKKFLNVPIFKFFCHTWNILKINFPLKKFVFAIVNNFRERNKPCPPPAEARLDQ